MAGAKRRSETKMNKPIIKKDEFKRRISICNLIKCDNILIVCYCCMEKWKNGSCKRERRENGKVFYWPSPMGAINCLSIGKGKFAPWPAEHRHWVKKIGLGFDVDVVKE